MTPFSVCHFDSSSLIRVKCTIQCKQEKKTSEINNTYVETFVFCETQNEREEIYTVMVFFHRAHLGRSEETRFLFSSSNDPIVVVIVVVCQKKKVFSLNAKDKV